jgi:hypothetical protein
MNSRNSIDMEFSLREYEALGALRAKYERGHGLLSEHELARLCFVRWLIHSPGWNKAMDQPITTQQGLRWIAGRTA